MLERIKRQPEKLSFERKVSLAIDKGLDYLTDHQLPNGEFCVYYAPDDQMAEWCVPDSAIFPTTIIATALRPLQKQTKTQEIYQKVIPFLVYQRMRFGLWGYYTKWHKLFPLLPPDADDTILTYYFLKSQAIDTPDPIPLILSNRNKKGLLYTWFTFRLNRNKDKRYWRTVLRELKYPIKSILFWTIHDCKRNDIDLGVNINVLSCLGETKETEPIIKYVSNKITKDDATNNDGWYQNPIVLYYLFSRIAKHKIKSFTDIYPIIITKILSHTQENGSIGFSQLDTALGISTLINLGHDGKEIQLGVSYLLKTQSNNGSWQRALFSYSGPKKIVGWGSEELTTALCLETLALFQKHQPNDDQP